MAAAAFAQPEKMPKHRKRAMACVAVSALVALLSVSLVLKTIPSSSSPDFSAKRVTLEASRGSQAVSLLVDVERKEQPGAWHSVNVGEGECKLLTPCRAGGAQRCALLRGTVLPLEFDEDGAGQTRVYLKNNTDVVHLMDIAKSRGANLGLSCALEAQLDLFKLGLGLGPKRIVNVELELGDTVATLPRMRLESHSFEATHDKNLTVLTEGSYTLHMAYSSTSGLANLLSKVPISVNVDVASPEHHALNGSLSVHADLNATRDDEAGEILLSLPFEVKGHANGKKLMKAVAATGKLVPDMLKMNHTKKAAASTSVRRLATMTQDLMDQMPEEGYDESWVLGVPIMDMIVGETHMNMDEGTLTMSGILMEEMIDIVGTVFVDEDNDRAELSVEVALMDETIIMLTIRADTSIGMDVADTAVLQLSNPGDSDTEFLNLNGVLSFSDTLAGEDDMKLQLKIDGETQFIQVSMLGVGQDGAEGTDVEFEFTDGTTPEMEAKGMFRDLGGDSWSFDITTTNFLDISVETGYTVEAGSNKFQGVANIDAMQASLSFTEISTGWDLMVGLTEGEGENSILNVDSTFRDVDGDISFATEVGGLIALEVSVDLTNVDAGFDFAFETTISENETTTTIGATANYRSEDDDTSLTLALSGIADIALTVQNTESAEGFDLQTALLMDGSQEAAFTLSNVEKNGNSSFVASFSGMEMNLGLDLEFTSEIPSDSIFRASVMLLEGSKLASVGSAMLTLRTFDTVFAMSELQEGRTQLLLEEPFDFFAGLKGPEGEEVAGLLIGIEQTASVVNANAQFMVSGSGGLELSFSSDASTGTSLVLESDLKMGDNESQCIDVNEVFVRQSFTCGESMMGFSGTLEHGGTDFSTGVITLRIMMEDNETGDMVEETNEMFVNASRGFLMASSIEGHDAMWFGMGMVVDGESMNMSDFALVRPAGGDVFFQQGASAVSPLLSAPVTEDEAVVVTGGLQISVPDAEAFCGNQAALDGISSVVAAASGSSASDTVTECANSASDSDAGGRRLQQSLDLKYSIVIKGDTTSGGAPPTADEIAAIAVATQTAIAAITPEALTTLVNEELSSRGLNIAVVVEAIEPPSVKVVDKAEIDAALDDEMTTTDEVFASQAATTSAATTSAASTSEADLDASNNDLGDEEQDAAPLVVRPGLAFAFGAAALAAAAAQ